MIKPTHNNKDYSDSRLKTNFAAISTPIAKVQALQGLTYNGLIPAGSGIDIDTTTSQVGLIAQAVQGVLPQAVVRADFDEEYNENGTTYSVSGENYLTVEYGRVVPLLVEAIKAQQVLIAAGIGIQGAQGIQGLTGIQGTQGLQGTQGTQGIQGQQGITGIQGFTGIQGTQGTTGLAFTVARTYASVAALTADTSPSGIVAGQFALINTSNVQDADNSKLYLWDGASYIFVNDLSGTAGIQGITGIQGAQGLQGTQGTQGIQGTQGTQGTQGIQGVQGTQGTQGLQGTQGTQGIQGLQGVQGTQGTQGIQGLQGIQGIQGVQGVDGAYAGQGIQGIQGRQGITGSQGITGTQGAQGTIGTQGTQGTQGASVTGAQGAQGAQGTSVTGAQGAQGTSVTGAQGTQGTSGATILGNNQTWTGTNTFNNTITGSISGNAGTAYGLNVHTGRNNEANKVVRTDGSGYIQAGWINSDSGDNGTTAITRITASNDSYLRYYTPANFATAAKLVTQMDGNRDTTNYNSRLTSGFYNAEGSPANNVGQGYAQLIVAKGVDTGWQLAGGYANNTIYTRGWHSSGTFYQWYTLLSDGNYNSYSPTLTGGNASGTWGINITGNAATISSQANSATITASTGVNVSQIVQRDGNGYIYANHINFSTSESENPTINSFFTSNGDGWSRKSSLAHAKNSIRGVADGTWGINVTGSSASCSGNSATATSAGTLSANASINGLNFSGVFALVGSGASTGNSTGARLSESYGPVWNCSNSATWHHQVINGSSLVGFQASGGNFGNGNILASGNVTAYYSDERLKTKIGNLDDALKKIISLNGFKYVNNDIAIQNGYKDTKIQVGLSAQEVQAVLPEAVTLAPFDMKGIPETGEIVSKSGENYLTIDYSRLVPLLIEAIKEQQSQIEELKLLVQSIAHK